MPFRCILDRQNRHQGTCRRQVCLQLPRINMRGNRLPLPLLPRARVGREAEVSFFHPGHMMEPGRHLSVAHLWQVDAGQGWLPTQNMVHKIASLGAHRTVRFRPCPIGGHRLGSRKR